MNNQQKEFCKKHNLTEKQFLGEEKIGCYLDLRGLTSIPTGFNPTVGGYLDLRGERKFIGSNIDSVKKPYIPKKIITWQDGKYVLIDGIFTEVISKNRNIYLVKRLHDKKEFYLVGNSKGTFYAHGDTLGQAKTDLHFKVISEKLKKVPIKPNTIITIQYYRIVTGSCLFGVQSWIKENIPSKELYNIEKNGIKAKDLLILLEKTNAYGLNKFRQLYNK